MKFSPFVMAGFLILMVILPDFSLSECVFGLDNIDQLIKRNNAILDIMNTTLFNYTHVANELLETPVSSSNIWTYLQKNHNVTPHNYLHFVSMGKLLDVTFSKKCTIPCGTVTSPINVTFIIPVHMELQNLAAYYSFSLGIFRPKEIQFNFMGTKNASSMDHSTLDTKCMAGSQFLWRIPTDFDYWYAFGDNRSLQFATFATMLERAFGRLYRRNTSALNKEFVRANVIHVKEVNKKCVAFMETYFLNSTHTADEIASLSSIDELRYVTYNNGINDPIRVNIFQNLTRIVNINSTVITDYLPNSTTYDMRLTTLATQTEVPSTAASTTILQTESPTIDPQQLLTSSNAATPAFSSAPTEESIIATTNRALTAPNYTNPPANTFSASLLTQLPETISTSLHDQPPANPSNLQSISIPSALDSSLSSSFGGNSTISFSNSESTTLSRFQMNYTWNASPNTTAPSNMSNSSQTTQLSETTANLTSSASNTRLLLPSSATTPSKLASPILSTKNTGTTEKTTTFDPDPFFKPAAPVIRKVYNVGLVTPATQEAAFLSITIPVVAGIILVAISCLFCLQVDWLGQRRTKEENAGI